MNSEERMKLILEDTGMKAATLAAFIGVPRFKVADVKCGKTKSISAELTKAICRKFPHFNPTWVLTGEGAIYATTQQVEISGNGNAAGNGNTAGMSEDIVRRLLDELAAQRMQTQNLIDILKTKLKEENDK